MRNFHTMPNTKVCNDQKLSQNFAMETCHHVKVAMICNVSKIMKDMFFYKYRKINLQYNYINGKCT